MRGMPPARDGMGALAAAPDLRARRLLRLFSAPARPRGRTPPRPVVRTGREVALMLCRITVRLSPGSWWRPWRSGPGPPGTGSKTGNWTQCEEAAMPVMGFTKFERFFRAAGGVSVDRDDVKRYLDFVNDAIYDLLIIGQATAKANVRDVIEPWDLPITKGLQESTHAFQRLEGETELGPILEPLTARPPLYATLDEEPEARLPLLFGGISVALARTFKLIDAELKAVHSEEWGRTFNLFRLLI